MATGVRKMLLFLGEVVPSGSLLRNVDVCSLSVLKRSDRCQPPRLSLKPFVGRRKMKHNKNKTKESPTESGRACLLVQACSLFPHYHVSFLAEGSFR